MRLAFATGVACLSLCAALHGQAPTTTTSISLNLTLAGSGDLNVGISLAGNGTIDPFGAASVSISVPPISNPSNVSVSFSFTLAGGDTLQASTSSGSAQVDSILGTASITGGTGKFSAATGSFSFLLQAPPGTTSSAVNVKFTGNGSITLPSTSVGSLTIAEGQLTFSSSAGSTATSTQIVTLSNQTGQSAAFTTSASTSSGGNWLSVSPASGTVAQFSAVPILVTTNPAGLAPGIYQGSVTISATGGPAFDVAVILAVTGSQPSLQLSQTGLRFQAVQGGSSPPAQIISVLNPGTASVNFTVTAMTLSGGNFLSVLPASGSSSSSSSATVTVNINPAGIAPGNYYGQIVFTPQGTQAAPLTASIVLNISTPANSPGPAVSTTGVIFVGQAGAQNPAAQSVVATNPSPNSLMIATASKATSGSVFFTAQPGATVLGGTPVSISVQPNLNGLAAGVYTGDLTVTFTDSVTLLVFQRDIAIVLIVTHGPAGSPGSLSAAPSASGCTPTKLIPVFTQLGAGFQVTAGYPAALEVTVVDDCGAFLTSGSVAATFSSGDPALALASLKNGKWTGTWNPRVTSVSQVTVTALAQEISPGIDGEAEVQGGLQPNPSVPIVFAGGVVSAASNAAHQPLGPGSYVSIYGSDLSQGVHQSPSLPLDTVLAGTQVILAGKVLPLNFVSSGQINAIVPFDIPVNVTQQLVVEQNGALSVPEPVVLSSAQPAIFTQDQSGKGLGVIVGYKADGSGHFLINDSHPVSTNDVLVIYCTGLGPVDQQVNAGSAGPSSPLAHTVNQVTVTVGGKNAKLLFAGLAPGTAVYQVNVVVPAAAGTGDSVPVVISTAGLESNSVTIAVK